MWKWAALLILLAACGQSSLSSRTTNDLEGRKIRRIAIYPLESISGRDKNRVPFSAGSSENPSEALISRQLYSTMSQRSTWQLVSDREVREMEPLVPSGSPESRVRRLGQLVYADAVLSGRVIRFHEREGEAIGAMSPASVAFVLELWDVKRGDSIWTVRFDETQKPLNEDLLNLGQVATRGVRWLKAEELSLEGVKKAVNQLHQVLYGKS